MSHRRIRRPTAMLCAPSGLYDAHGCDAAVQVADAGTGSARARDARSRRSNSARTAVARPRRAHTVHEYISSGLGSKSFACLHARQVGERAELGGDRHVVVGLGHDRRLAGERVAHQRELVAACPSETCRSRQLLEPLLQRRLERRRPRAAASRGSGTRLRCRCRSRTAMPSGSSLRRTHVRVRQRAVVHQAEVLAGRERMRVRRRHGRLGGHARVADEMRALQRAKP